jgi:hypothetical protein
MSYILRQEELDELLALRPAPTVTDESLNAKIHEVTFYKHKHQTLCVIELKNGFFLNGEAAPAAPENYNESVGRHYAFLDARRKIWKVEGYLLRQRLFEETKDAR